MYAANIFSVTIVISFHLIGAEMTAWSVYEVLSQRIDNELSLLRHELSSTEEKLRQNHEVLEYLKEKCSATGVLLPDDKRTDGRSLVSNLRYSQLKLNYLIKQKPQIHNIYVKTS